MQIGATSNLTLSTVSQPWVNTSTSTGSFSLDPYNYATTKTCTISSSPSCTIVFNKEPPEEKKEKNNIFIKNIKIPKSNPRVVIFTFQDNTVIKTICDEQDDFSLMFACFLAIGKKLYKNDYTFDGIYFIVKNQLQYNKEYIKIAKDAIRKYVNNLKQQEQEEKKRQELKELQNRKYEKNMKRRKLEREKRINELAEAIKKASE